MVDEHLICIEAGKNTAPGQLAVFERNSRHPYQHNPEMEGTDEPGEVYLVGGAPAIAVAATPYVIGKIDKRELREVSCDDVTKAPKPGTGVQSQLDAAHSMGGVAPAPTMTEAKGDGGAQGAKAK